MADRRKVMKCWQKLLLAMSIITMIATIAILVLDYNRDKKIYGAVKDLIERKRHLIQL